MSIFGKTENVYLASPLEGVILNEGAPLAGTRLLRVLSLAGEEVLEEEAVSDEKGRFSFPDRRKSIKLTPLMELVISQKIYVLHEGEKNLVWLKSKRSPEVYSELGGRPVNFRCDITSPMRRVDIGRGLFETSCQWDSIKSE
ncbi:DUF6795 domain-containing protein [Marinimicrobium locisalis]|uniref:DUF6795 domain-containing protein n=1 Tax=Marinimicrobium locisalis TaxID=546022 RepID=UPI0032219C21